MQLEDIISRNQRFIPFLMHCLNLLLQKYPLLKKDQEKLEEFMTYFIKHKVKEIEDKIISDACEFMEK